MMFDHLFESIEERSRWAVSYAEFLKRVWRGLYLVEAIGIADIVLRQDEQDENIRFTLWELEHYVETKLLKLEVERKGQNIYPIQYIIKDDSYVVFGFNYYGFKDDQIIVSNITSMDDNHVLCHFLYGHHSLGEFIKKTDIIGLGVGKTKDGEDPTGIPLTKIKGWTGQYRIFLHSKLEQIQKRHETSEP